MQVSTSTVVEAYERLAAEGAIRSRPGSGFYVAGQLAPLSLAEIGPRLDRAVDPFWVSRQSLEAGDDVLKPGCGWLPAVMAAGGGPAPGAAHARARRRRRARRLRHAARPAAAAPAPGAAHGRARHRGLARPDHADGIGHAGDRSAVPLPDRTRRYGAGRRSLLFQFPRPAARASGQDRQRALHARRDRTSSCSRRRWPSTGRASTSPIPRIHNPTGATLSPVTAHRLLKLADQSDLTIIEDDIFADFEHTPGAAARGVRRARPRRPYRQFLQDAFGLGALRLHRRAPRLDRGADRPQDRHVLRRRAAGGGTGADAAAATAAIASTWSGCARGLSRAMGETSAPG